MRIIAGIISFLAVVIIGIIILLISSFNKRNKKDI